MATTLKLKRRSSAGAAGAPAALKSGEPAYNEADNILYLGVGDDGGGNATSVAPIAGSGAMVNLTAAQTVGGKKTFSVVPGSSQDASATTDLVRKGQMDAGLATKAATTHSHAIADVTGLQTALDGKLATAGTAANATKLVTARNIALSGDVTGTVAFDGSANVTITAVVVDDSHNHIISNVDGLQAALDLKAPLASPALTGTPTAPTPAPADNTTKIATTAYVQNAITSFGAGDMAKSIYDTTNNGKVDLAEVAEAVAWTGVSGKPATFPATAHSHTIADTTGLQAALDTKAALASPALTGTPTAPTAVPTTNTTQIATTAFVQAAFTALIDGAPGAIDTLNELAAALGDDPNFATTVTNSIATKLSAASNLSDLANAGTARTNLGLGSMATQNANAVAITGGTIDGTTVIDCGTF